MDVVTWFDPRSTDHLEAYRELQKTGMWPEGFIPDGIKFPTLWQVSLMAKLADEWLDYALEVTGPILFDE